MLKGRGAAAVVVVALIGGLGATIALAGLGEDAVSIPPLKASPSSSPSSSEKPGAEGLLRLAGPKRLRYCFHSAPESVTTPAPGGERDDNYDTQYAYIAHRVEALRKLFFYSEVPAHYVTNHDMRQQLLVEGRQTYPRRRSAQLEVTLRMLGALKGPIDLSRTKMSNPLGVYFPSGGELYVLVDSYEGILEAPEQVTVAHELTHALTDQQLDLPYNERVVLGTHDEALAHSALAEGDATLVEQQFAHSSLTEDELLAYKSNPPPTPYSPPQGTTRKTKSFYLPAQADFPYSFGTSFVCAVYLRGGWEAVNDMYKDPPDTTAEILYPERYHSDDAPHDPEDPPTPNGWSELPVQEFGAADLMWLFAAPATDEVRALKDPYVQAAAWGGGEIHLYRRDHSNALSLDLSQHVGFDDLCDSVEAWYRVSFPITREYEAQGGERFAIANRWGAAVLRCSGDDVRLGVAPNLATARTLAR